MGEFSEKIKSFLNEELNVSEKQATPVQLYHAVSKAAMQELRNTWNHPKEGKRACYFSAEFLLGRLVYSNLMNMGLLGECTAYLKENNLDPAIFEQIEDDALGNGGLGRLAACFLDSAATHSVALDGYGIRYRYGLFRQSFEDGFQKETADDWMRFGDPWSVRKEEDSVCVTFADQTVRAVPYDMPVIGYGGKTVNTLRLWQSEPVKAFDFTLFNDQKYELAVQEKNRAEQISYVLYPNDDTDEGKRLRLKQQYFFSSASLQSILRAYQKRHGEDFSSFAKEYAIQLNDTHPTVSIPELLRLLMEDHQLDFEEAFAIVRDTFAYTNHTIMAEALEKWYVPLFLSVLPHVYPYVVMLQNRLYRELLCNGTARTEWEKYAILQGNMVHMARMAIYASHSINGVAQIHSDLLKARELHEWYTLYPERFSNKTNGITQRRWLALCNPELSAFITEKAGDGWVTDLTLLREMEKCADEKDAIQRFMQIKRQKKEQLCKVLEEKEGVKVSPDFIFDIQVKRLHEYKRQLLNAFSILDLYYSMKEGSLKDFHPTLFLFGAKAAPGYFRAKGIIKYINEIAKMVNRDPDVNQRMQVLFVQNYDVSYAEKLIPAADVSEQISTAGTEASGTSNMKLMLNGAVTLGTLDGANVEIVEQAGAENNYIFGAKLDELQGISESYDPNVLYQHEPRIKRVVDTLIDGTFDDGNTGMFRELYTSLLKGASWHKPDQYYLLHDFLSYCDAKLRVNREYGEREAFARKCIMNIAGAGTFSSDRTIAQYASEIWNVPYED